MQTVSLCESSPNMHISPFSLFMSFYLSISIGSLNDFQRFVFRVKLKYHVINTDVFGNGLSWYWVEVSLFLNTVALTNQIILKILTYIRPSLAQTLGNNYFILIPSIIVALMLSILFVSKAIIVPNGCRTFH
jgi:hypothetical protein